MVFFSHSGYADHHVERAYRAIEKHTKSKKKNIRIVGGDFNAELGPGFGVERVSVGPHTRGEQERRLDEAMADATEVDRKHMCCSRDAEASDMIHMGSDHRSVMAQFVITASHFEEKENTNSREPIESRRRKIRSGEANMFEEHHAELERKIKQEAETAATAQKPKVTEQRWSKRKEVCRC